MSRQSVLDDRLVQFVRRAGLGGAAAAFLEGMRPVALVGAQLAYVAGPLFGSRQDWQSLGRRLEDEAALDEAVAALLDDEADS
jgi:hypothetical protein